MQITYKPEVLKLKKGAISLLKTDAFLSTLLLKLKLVEDNSIPTAAVNGKSLIYNTEFIKTLSTDEITWLLAHEVWHVALGHHLMAKKIVDKATTVPEKQEQMMTFNIAADLAINSGPIRMRQGRIATSIYPGQSPFTGMQAGEPTEHYLNELKKNKKQYNYVLPNGKSAGSSGEGQEKEEGSEKGEGKEGQTGNDSAGTEKKPGSSSGIGQPQRSSVEHAGTSSAKQVPALDEVRPYPLSTGETEEEAEVKWRNTVIQAAMEAKQCGQDPGYLEELISSVAGVSKVNWKAMLRRFCSRIVHTGSSYARPSRRTAHLKPFILPSRMSKGCGRILFAIDSSGSMSMEQCSLALDELESILATVKGVTVTLIQCDTRVCYQRDFTCDQFPLPRNEITLHGRGGTDFRPVFELATKLSDLQCIIYLTDLDGQFPESSMFPTIWLTTGSTKVVPFGEAVPMEG